MMPATNRLYLAALCLARAGLRIDSEKAYLIESRLSPVARREGFTSVEGLIEAARERGDERLNLAMVEAMVLPETEFFRDWPVFEALAGEVLPALVREKGGEPVKVWSAACGGGQEIYSLAIMLAEAGGLASKVELFASDISERNLEKAQAGLYSQIEVQRGLPARALVNHFEKRGESFGVSPRLRQMVRWRRVNLLDDLARFGRFDVVLCRGLLPQLAPEAQARVLDNLGAALTPEGRLVLGLKDAAPGFAVVATGLGLFGPPADGVRSAA
jgi:chemotaxis protein methyltransferase CheR